MDNLKLKKCSNRYCSETNPQTIDKFYKNRTTKDGLGWCCKTCDKIRSNKQLKNNPNYRKNKLKEWKKVNKPKIHIHHRTKIYKKYDITEEIYNEMLKSQNYECAICKKHRDIIKRELNIDHNHITGKIRGLLCSNCNTGIGLLKADFGLDIILKSIEYLKK